MACVFIILGLLLSLTSPLESEPLPVVNQASKVCVFLGSAELNTPLDTIKRRATSRLHENFLVQVGDKAPDFIAARVSGDTVRLSDFRGNVVLLNFWATWCGPCRQEFGLLAEELFADDFRPANFAFLPVARGQTQEEVAERQAELVEAGFRNFNSAVDPGQAIWSDYATEGIPKSVLIDKDGFIAYLSAGGGKRTVKKLIKQVKFALSE